MRERLLGRPTGTIVVNGEKMDFWLPVGVPPLDSWGSLPYETKPKLDGLEELIGKAPEKTPGQLIIEGLKDAVRHARRSATDAQASARNPPDIGRTEQDESNAADEECPF